MIKKELLDDIKKELEIEEDIRIVFKKYKRTIAIIIPEKKEIRINSIFVDADYKILKYIILHEITHLKTGSKYHSWRFREFIRKYFNKEEELNILVAIYDRMRNARAFFERLSGDT